MPSLSLQIASAALVGNNIGAGNVQLAKTYAKTLEIFTLVQTAFMIVLTIVLKRIISELYTDVGAL